MDAAGLELRSTGRRSARSGWPLPYAGHFNVPLILVTGDQAACTEAERTISGVVTTSVKHAIDSEHAHFETPCTIDVTYVNSDFADMASGDSRFSRIDDVTVRTVIQSTEALFRSMPPG